MKPGPAPTDAGAPPSPWWRLRIMWLVVGGPLAVVVASLVTVVIAVTGADEVLDTGSGRRPASAGSADAPAISARNHAATPKSP